jgi:circadian clock protein KaiC
MHLVVIYKHIKQFKPKTVILDPVTNLVTVGNISEVKGILIRLIDFLQSQQITVLFTALTLNIINTQTDEGISSLVDTWLLLSDIEHNGERNRGLYIIKSRGMYHSNQVREFVITSKGLKLINVFLGPEGVLTGSAREAQKLLEETNDALRKNEAGRKEREIERRKMILDAKIASLNSRFESTKASLNSSYEEEEVKKKILEKNRKDMTNRRSRSSALYNGKPKNQTK